MTYDFFAAKDDKVRLLEFIFKETDLQVFDSYSESEQEICEYKSVNDIVSKFDLEYGWQMFHLWAPSFTGAIMYRKIDLSPKHCDGRTFKYATNGWGLIQLNFENLGDNALGYSHIGHFNEKGVPGRSVVVPDMGNGSDWNWKEIEKTSRKLKYTIHNKWSVRKIGSFGVLPGADMLSKQGIYVGYGNLK